MHAEPTPSGQVRALALQADRDRRRMRQAARHRSRQAVRRRGHLLQHRPAVEAHVCAALGLRPVPATQVIARDRHAEFLWACASVGPRWSSCAPRSATWPGASWGAEEPFAAGQKGSSAMPTSATPSSRNACAVWPACSRLSGRDWRTSRCGTSGTSRTARWSGGTPGRVAPGLLHLRKATGLASGWSSTPTGAGEPDQWQLRLSSASPSCWRWSPPADPDEPTASSNATPGRLEERRPFREYWSPTPPSPSPTPNSKRLRSDPHLAAHRPLRGRPDCCRDDDLPQILSGKVRELYDAGDDRLLMVASDRVSAFE